MPPFAAIPDFSLKGWARCRRREKGKAGEGEGLGQKEWNRGELVPKMFCDAYWEELGGIGHITTSGGSTGVNIKFK